MTGERPFIEATLKVFYIDTFSLLEQNKNFKQLAPITRQLENTKCKKIENDSEKLVAFDIYWNSSYTYDQFIQYLMESKEIVAAKIDVKKRKNSIRMVDIDNLLCV